MTPKRLSKIRSELNACLRGQAKAADLEKLAARLGRRQVKRGKEPTWESARFPELNVLTIPHHGGKDLAIGTRRNILAALEDDVTRWEQELDDGGHQEGGEEDENDDAE